MNFTISSSEDIKPLASGRFPDGRGYQVVLLPGTQAGLIADFHAAVINQLNPNEKSFIFPKTRAFFEDCLNRGSGNAMLGVLAEDGRLLAQAMILHPGADRPETGMVDMALPAAPEDLSILQAVSVCPSHRGLALMALMVGHWISHAATSGRGHVLAEIDVKNRPSWVSFLNKGLDLVGIGVDPADGTEVYNAYQKTTLARPRSWAGIFDDAARHIACDVENTALQKGLFKQGARCTGFKKEDNSLVFRCA